MSPESSKDIIISIIIILIVLVVGYLAYTRGFFNGQQEVKSQDPHALEVNVGGNNTQPSQY